MQTFLREEGLVLKNLSTKRAETEEDLLQTLFLGDTNRVVCETPLNDKSTRSHCIFTVYLESQKMNSEVKNFSKINLVDLSGSEKLGKTQSQGRLMHEACNINLSLHFLEQVIVALQEVSQGKADRFVPYRNSLMTLVLKDSLGGNCQTRMISTISLDYGNLPESISTCNFAQRVALIKNKVTKNLVVDPNVLIAKLKSENEQLKKEIEGFHGLKARDFLTEQDKQDCRVFVQSYILQSEVEIP